MSEQLLVLSLGLAVGILLILFVAVALQKIRGGKTSSELSTDGSKKEEKKDDKKREWKTPQWIASMWGAFTTGLMYIAVIVGGILIISLAIRFAPTVMGWTSEIANMPVTTSDPFPSLSVSSVPPIPEEELDVTYGTTLRQEQHDRNRLAKDARELGREQGRESILKFPPHPSWVSKRQLVPEGTWPRHFSVTLPQPRKNPAQEWMDQDVQGERVILDDRFTYELTATAASKIFYISHPSGKDIQLPKFPGFWGDVDPREKDQVEFPDHGQYWRKGWRMTIDPPFTGPFCFKVLATKVTDLRHCEEKGFRWTFSIRPIGLRGSPEIKHLVKENYYDRMAKN